MDGGDKNNGKRDGENPHRANPEYEKFQRFLEGTLNVPKEELDKRREEYEREKKRAG